MKYTIFERRRNFIQSMMTIFFGIIASSCSPQLNIPEITAEAQNELLMLDESERPYNRAMNRPVQEEDITDGVIEDYITLIDFLIARNELRAKSLTQTVPIFTDTGITYPRVIFFYMGGYDIDRDNYKFHLNQCKTIACREGIAQSPAHPIYVDRCRDECAKILFEDHAKSVLKVEISPDSLEVVPSSIREFRKTDDCSLSSEYRTSGFSRHELPALGLCLDMQTPENGLELIEKDSLHVFGTWNSLISPFRPEEFWVDSSFRAPLSIGMRSYRRGVHVMKDLEHVAAQMSRKTKHRAIGIRSHGRPIEYSMLFDYTCISIDLELPEKVVNELIKARAGKTSLNPSDAEGDKFYFGDDGLCQGQYPDGMEFFGLFSEETKSRFDLASLFSPQEIENKLNATLQRAKDKGDSAEDWRDLNKAIHILKRHHPEFDGELARRIKPMVIELAKHDLRTSSD